MAGHGVVLQPGVLRNTDVKPYALREGPDVQKGDLGQALRAEVDLAVQADGVELQGREILFPAAGGTVARVDLPPGTGITVEDEGNRLGDVGTADTLNVAGAGATLTRAGNVATLHVPGLPEVDAASATGDLVATSAVAVGLPTTNTSFFGHVAWTVEADKQAQYGGNLDELLELPLIPEDHVLGLWLKVYVGGLDAEHLRSATMMPFPVVGGAPTITQHLTVGAVGGQNVYLEANFGFDTGTGRWTMTLSRGNRNLPAQTRVRVFQAVTEAVALEGGQASPPVTDAQIDARVRSDANAATRLQRGVVELADPAEVTAGTDDERAMTPARTRQMVDASLPAFVQNIPVPGAGDVGQALRVQADSSQASGVAIRWAADPEVPPVRQQAIYQAAKSILVAGQGVELTDDDVRRRITIAAGVPSGNELPPKPWRIGQRFRLLRDQQLRHDPVIRVSERDSGATSNEFELPGQLNAMGPRFIRSYSLEWGPGQTNPLRDGAFIDSTTAPLPGAQLVWYPANREYNPATDLYAIADGITPGYQRWYKVGNNASGDRLSFGGGTGGPTDPGTDDEAQTGGYHVDIIGWSTAGEPLYPADTLMADDLTFEGGDAGVQGWVRTPGIGLDRAQVEALVRRIAPTEAITVVHDGPATSLPVVLANASNATHAFTTPDGTFDLDDDESRNGVLEVSATLTLQSISGAGADQTLGFESPGVQQINISGFVTAADLRRLTVNGNALPTAASGKRIGEAIALQTSAQGGPLTQGELALWIVRVADNTLRYRWVWTVGAGGAGQFAYGTNISALFIHEAGTSAVRSFIVRRSPPADVDVTSQSDGSWSGYSIVVPETVPLTAEQADGNLNVQAHVHFEARSTTAGRYFTQVSLEHLRAGVVLNSRMVTAYAPRNLSSGSADYQGASRQESVEISYLFMQSEIQVGDTFRVRGQTTTQNASQTLRFTAAGTVLEIGPI